MSDPRPSERRLPPAVLRPERIDDGCVVRLPWCMPRALDLLVMVFALAVGMTPVGISMNWVSTDGLCFAIPAMLCVVAVGFGVYYGVRFLLGRGLATRFELRPDGVKIGSDWLPSESLPEATRTHRVYRSKRNAGGSQSKKRIDTLHLGDRSFACDVGPAAVDWLVDELNAMRWGR